jgi:glycosyltransferase involved in cell wall biosynthesis
VTQAADVERLYAVAGPVSPQERRLLVISYHHPPDGAIGGMRWAGLTKHLGRLGWRSWILAAAPRPAAGPEGGVTVVSCPRRRTVNDLYRTFRQRDGAKPSSGGRIAEPSSANGDGLLARLRLEAAMLLSLPDDGRGWILRAAVQARKLIAQVQPDVVVSTGPPHSAHVAAWLATRGRGVRWLVDFRDPWAGPVTGAWRDWPLYRSRLGCFLMSALERLAVRTANSVVCNTREFAAVIRARYPRAHVWWVPNGVDVELLPPRLSSRVPGLSIAYVGTVYGGRDLTPVLQALRLFLDHHPDIPRELCRLRIAGHMEGSQLQRLREDIAALGVEERVELLGMLSRDAALRLVGDSSLGVVLAQEQELQVPAKLYELVALGVATVVLATPGSAAHSEALRIGASVVDPGDIAGLARLMGDVSAGRVMHDDLPRVSVDYADLALEVSQLLVESPRATGERTSR